MNSKKPEAPKIIEERDERIMYGCLKWVVLPGTIITAVGGFLSSFLLFLLPYKAIKATGEIIIVIGLIIVFLGTFSGFTQLIIGFTRWSSYKVDKLMGWIEGTPPESYDEDDEHKEDEKNESDISF